MTLLDHYLRAVRIYLPNSPQKADILAELEDLLRSTMDDRAEQLGRPLSEGEQEEILTRHGNPTTVAARYGATNLGVAFGRQLITPESFPLYARILVAQFAITLVVVSIIEATSDPIPSSFLSRLLWPMLAQFMMTTSVFIGIDILRRRTALAGGAPGGPQFWSFPPPHLQPVPRWQSASGFVILAMTAAWWASLPALPWLVLGRWSRVLTLQPVWSEMYWPILTLLLIGITQRALTFWRPDWNWLQPIVRTLTNGLAVALVPVILAGYPFLAVADGVQDPAAAAAARGFNTALWWHVLASFGLYWLITCAVHLYLCLRHLRAALQRRAWQLV